MMRKQVATDSCSIWAKSRVSRLISSTGSRAEAQTG